LSFDCDAERFDNVSFAKVAERSPFSQPRL
jgi:hypothetical protein